ncbi:hypothetical protein C8R45DRAFT_973127 [Mycena sanguinolenta]|nr:hypothetical protein C8R45DRAFT_973127 [Mycena sanguinolenta]
MCDALLTSIILGAISLIPYNRYILWGLGSAGLVLYAADRERPSNKLRPLEVSINSVGETLDLANATCTTGHNYVELMEVTNRFCELKLSASNIKSRLLETHNVSTWKELKEHARNSKTIWESIHRCEKKVKEIRTLIECIIEAEHQRELSQDIQKSREIMSSLTRRASAVNRHIGSATGSYESM